MAEFSATVDGITITASSLAELHEALAEVETKPAEADIAPDEPKLAIGNDRPLTPKQWSLICHLRKTAKLSWSDATKFLNDQVLDHRVSRLKGELTIDEGKRAIDALRGLRNVGQLDERRVR